LRLRGARWQKRQESGSGIEIVNRRIGIVIYPQQSVSHRRRGTSGSIPDLQQKRIAYLVLKERIYLCVVAGDNMDSETHDNRYERIRSFTGSALIIR
jgi:hypothetical protein